MNMTDNRNFIEKYLIPSKHDTRAELIKKVAYLAGIVVVIAAVIITIAYFATKQAGPGPVSNIDLANVSDQSSEDVSSEDTSSQEVSSEIFVDPMDTLVWKEEELKKSVIVASASTVREKPSPLAAAVKTIDKDTEIKVVGKTDNGYLKLDDGTFISEGLVKDKKTTNTGGGTTQKPVTPDKPPVTKPTQSATEAAAAAGIQEKFADPYSKNKQLKGQIFVPGTGKIYYVAQAGNNTSYLNKNFYGGRDSWGNPYLDFRCNITPAFGSHIVMYAHSNDTAGTQFSGFKNYKDVNFYKSNPTIQFNTIYGDATYKIVGFFKEDTTPKSGYFRYHDIAGKSVGTSTSSYIETVRSKSYWNTNVDVEDSDQLLVISTCWDTNSANYNRLVTVARKVREGEDTSVDTSGCEQLKPVVLNKFGK